MVAFTSHMLANLHGCVPLGWEKDVADVEGFVNKERAHNVLQSFKKGKVC